MQSANLSPNQMQEKKRSFYYCRKIKMAEMVNISIQEFFNSKILASEGLVHIGENIFDQVDGKTLANCEEVSPIWRQFIVNYGLWKRRYLDKLAKQGSDAHRLIKSNPKLFQFDLQAHQGNFHIFADIAHRV
jgi:hypothetical protein